MQASDTGTTQTKTGQELWQKYCGHMDLDIQQFMGIQRRLLEEQLDLYGRSGLGKVFFGETPVKSMEEFRERVPLTTYSDYLPYLSDRREDLLPLKPRVWARTSGRSGYYSVKWVPYTEGMYRAAGLASISAFVMGAARWRGDFRMEPGDVLLATFAPAPYISGAVMAPAIAEEFPLKVIPPLKESEGVSFEERVRWGFKLALTEGIDHFVGLGSVLVRTAELLSSGLRPPGGGSGRRLPPPAALWRIARGMVRSKLARRPLYPRDLWKLKSIIVVGMDTTAYADAITMYWGVKPIEGYGCTELSVPFHQTWTKGGMAPLSFTGFWEFIPLEEHIQSKQDPSYRPRTVLTDALQPGVYEIVGTNFYGGALVRYRIGDLLRVVAQEDPESGVRLPHAVFEARGDDVLDLGGFTRLTEKTFILALARTGVSWQEWAVVKEMTGGKPTLKLYLELKPGQETSEATLARDLHDALKELDSDYRDLEAMVRGGGVNVVLLPPGTFQRYMVYQAARGADLGHLKVPRMQPSPEVLATLLNPPQEV